ncbi:transmembrane protein 184C-like isoform X2 [Paramacrobiotus metropolitanus]|uniref:transmembrane protein 184C-like isoform X2 n=1 Tax=Paramacrobiotus metropolitanus TaxID=2943436 RepID=UPI0024461AE0|nr:transmembrane protein 184C-like isoform X2 [Paramacrobiotus metropolitanus]
MSRLAIWTIGKNWRSWIEPFVFFVYIVLLIIAIPICALIFAKEKTNLRTRTWFVGGIFVLMSLPVSLHTILQHLIHYTKPNFQLHIVRILWMPPIYSLTAWLSLRFPESAIYFETFRQCYEAYVVYNFMRFLLNYLEEKIVVINILESKPPQKHLIPFRLVLKPWQMGAEYLLNCKLGTLQYTVIMPVITAISFLCESLDVYHEGIFSGSSAWTYLIVFANISQIWAMYCLIMFYLVFREELKPMYPLAKFLCVKFVVFASFWQQIFIAILTNAGVTQWQTAIPENDIRSISTGLQDIIICAEMIVASVAHYFAFSYKPYVNLDVPQTPCCPSFWAMFGIQDVKTDVMEQARSVGRFSNKSNPAKSSVIPNS